jgi:hypothetical protein
MASQMLVAAAAFSPVASFQPTQLGKVGAIASTSRQYGRNLLPFPIAKHHLATRPYLGNVMTADAATPALPKPALLVPAERYTSGDWWKSLSRLPRSFTFRRISSQLLANTIFAVLVYLAYVAFPETMKALLKGMIPAPGPHLMVSGVLGLLLVFRTNTAYDRYWEGRRLWGFLYSRTRDLARLAHTSLRGKDREHFLQLVAATPPILLQHLRAGWLVRGESPAGYDLDIEKMVKNLLPEEDHAALLAAHNRRARRSLISHISSLSPPSSSLSPPSHFFFCLFGCSPSLPFPLMPFSPSLSYMSLPSLSSFLLSHTLLHIRS